MQAQEAPRKPDFQLIAPQVLSLNVELWAGFDLCQVLSDIPEGLTSLSIHDSPSDSEHGSETLELLAVTPFQLAHLELIDALPTGGPTVVTIPARLCDSLTELVLNSSTHTHRCCWAPPCMR